MGRFASLTVFFVTVTDVLQLGSCERLWYNSASPIVALFFFYAAQIFGRLEKHAALSKVILF